MSTRPETTDDPSSTDTSTNTNADERELRSIVADLADRVDELEAENERLTERVAELEAHNEALSKRLDTEAEQREDTRHSIAKLKGRIATVEDATDDGDDTTGDTDDDDSSPESPGDDRSPLERITDGEHTGIKITPSISRAARIMENWSRWSDPSPSGRLLHENLRTLLETACDEDLAWKQVYRACEKVESLTKGKIVFTEIPDRGKGLLQPASASST